MKIYFFGLGSIGQKHLRLINELYDFDIYAFRTLIQPIRTVGIDGLNRTCDLFGFNQIEEIKPDVAFICNPTNLHIETAIKCAERGMHIFCEKPLDCRIDYGLQHLINLIQTKNLTSYLAYPLRHHPAVIELKKKTYRNKTLYFVCHSNFTTWRNYETYSNHYTQGGGALLELSHEIDLAAYLLGDIIEIEGSTSRAVDAPTDAETSAFLKIWHKNNNTSYHSLKIFCNQELRFVRLDNGQKVNLQSDDTIFKNQLEYFFDNVNNPKIMNNIPEAVGLYKKIIEFREKERK